MDDASEENGNSRSPSGMTTKKATAKAKAKKRRLMGEAPSVDVVQHLSWA
jgi:hypothetical protein